MSLADLTHADFAPHVGTDFIRPADELAPETRFRLTAAKLVGSPPTDGSRQQYQLTFLVDSQESWGQGTCLLSHPVMGEHDLFLVAAARTEQGIEYCASFS